MTWLYFLRFWDARVKAASKMLVKLTPDELDGVCAQGEAHQVLAVLDGRRRHVGQRVVAQVQVDQVGQTSEKDNTKLVI